MSDDTTKTPLAVRLARVAFPGKPWRNDWESKSPMALYERGAKAMVGDILIAEEMDFFSLDDLNALHTCERRIVDAVGGHTYAAFLLGSVGIKMDGSDRDRWLVHAVTATAAQRAAALQAFLDAHPDLEERLTKHE